MNHRVSQRKLNRTTSHRKALRRNLAQSLFEHGKITTTLPKAKDVRPFAEKLITLAKRAKKGDLVARRRIHKLLGERSLIPREHRGSYEMMSDAARAQVIAAKTGRRHRTGQPKGRLEFTAETISHRLIESVSTQYDGRDGGYTRLIKLAKRRVGDQSPLAVLELVGDEEHPGSVTKAAKGARRRRADARYAAAIKASKAGTSSTKAPEPAVEEAPAEPVAEESADSAAEETKEE